MNKYAKKSIVDLLLDKGVISRDNLEAVKIEEHKTRESLFKILPRLGVITSERLAEFISTHTGIPRVELGYLNVERDVVGLLPEELIRKHNVLPILKIGDRLTCAMFDVFNVHALDEVALRTGMIIELAVATDEEIKKVVDEIFVSAIDMRAAIKSMDAQKTGGNEKPAMDVFKVQENAGDEAPVVRFVSLMIAKAVSEGASDIHVEPEEDSLTVRFRIDGILQLQPMPPKQYRDAIISRLKIMASLDIAEHRKPQDGRIQMQIENRRIDIRISFLPTVYGENVVMRLLDTTSIKLGLEQIGLQGKLFENFKTLLDKPNGIILVTGPTGSGKTTTLYSSISTINKPGISIVTIEDPVEYRLPGIRQTQVDPKVELTFAKGLRSILRQDPDVIMIGEIRDGETATIAIQAALTGHLVLATLHTNNAAGAITRLVDIGVEPFLLSSSVIGVLAQRLVRVACRECRGIGCPSCNMSGYKGRTGIYELLMMDEQVRQLILHKASSEEIHKAALAAGMQSLRDNGMEKVAQGVTRQEEVFRVTQEE